METCFRELESCLGHEVYSQIDRKIGREIDRQKINKKWKHDLEKQRIIFIMRYITDSWVDIQLVRIVIDLVDTNVQIVGQIVGQIDGQIVGYIIGQTVGQIFS